MSLPGVADVVARVSDAAFGNRLITNVLRGHVAEAIVALALEPEWTWCSADYAAWDFQRADGVRLEVKQSSVAQSWAANPATLVRPAFDIGARTGRWDGAVWIGEPGRQADLYLFCLHERRDGAADHRDPDQWQFFVVPTRALPAIKRIGIAPVRRLAEPVGFPDLAGRVAFVAAPLVRS